MEVRISHRHSGIAALYRGDGERQPETDQDICKETYEFQALFSLYIKLRSTDTEPKKHGEVP